jgi:hypothetical protein
VATIEFCTRNGYRWSPPPHDEDGEATATVFLGLAAAPINDRVIKELAEWIADRIGFHSQPFGRTALGDPTASGD